MMARLSLLHSLPRLASTAPFLCLIVAQWEWPDMASPSHGLRQVYLLVVSPQARGETGRGQRPRRRSFSFTSSACLAWLRRTPALYWSSDFCHAFAAAPLSPRRKQTSPR